MKKLTRNPNFKYERIYEKISCYTTAYNCIQENYPLVESIKSFLPICFELIVVDGCSNDGTWEKLQELAEQEPKLQIYQNEFDWNEPGVDGLQKAFSRALCSGDYLVQFDVDEIIHESDYEKWKLIPKRFPKQSDILHLPMVELWGNSQEATGRRHTWKWRISRNKPEISHGINKQARITNEETGVVYAKDGASDGCEYVNCINYEHVGCVGFYNQDLELIRLHASQQFAEAMNNIYDHLPSVWHTSWMDLPRKINQLKKGGTWDRLWSLLYQKPTMERFPDISTKEDVDKLAQKLYDQGGEDSDSVKFKFLVSRMAPKLLQDWINNSAK